MQCDVVLLTCLVGGMLIRPSCVRAFHLFPGPSPLHTLRHRLSPSGRCWLPREIPRGTGPNRRVLQLLLLFASSDLPQRTVI